MSHRLIDHVYYLPGASHLVVLRIFLNSQISSRRKSDSREYFVHSSVHNLLLLLPGPLSIVRSSNQFELLPHFD